MTPAVREALLKGVAGATETHDAFGSRVHLEGGLKPVDVFGLIENLQIPLEFADLDKLLGACVRVSSTNVGILVTSRRDLHMQRFTAAHELGHFVLEHEGSFDDEIRMPGDDARNRDLREVEADAFAAELLLPRWLVRAICHRQNWWNADSLRNPSTVYQLSLRCGTSFSATAWGLASHQYVNHSEAQRLVANGAPVKAAKTKALQGVELPNAWSDVWVLSQSDHGSTLAAGPGDMLVLHLPERPATGYRWDLSGAVEQGFRVVADANDFDPDLIGGTGQRRIVLEAPRGGVRTVNLFQQRAFSGKRGSQSLQLTISCVGALGAGAYSAARDAWH